MPSRQDICRGYQCAATPICWRTVNVHNYKNYMRVTIAVWLTIADGSHREDRERKDCDH